MSCCCLYSLKLRRELRAGFDLICNYLGFQSDSDTEMNNEGWVMKLNLL